MNERLQAFALAAILAACLAGAGRLDMDMARARDARRPGIGALKGASPGFMLAVTALGGFRGVLVDLLWSRAVDLQDRGAYFEIAQLADWITKLEPDLTGVWTFHAWNMAYNIGYTFPDPRDRWRWVKNGISLLRDEGLEVNPADGGLCLELGWIYQHKIGGIFDTAHPYFKAQLAAEMDSALGGPGPSRLEGRREAEFSARFKMDPAEMRRIDLKYGPLDWRLPESHALYWALQALARNAKSATTLSANRMLYQSMAEAFRNGRLEFNPDTGEYATRPNIELLPKALRVFEEALGASGDRSFREAHASFLGEAVMILFTFNRREAARELYGRLLDRYPWPGAPAAAEEYIYQSIVRSLRQEQGSTTAAIVEGFLFQAFVQFAEGEEERAAGFHAIGKLLWRQHMKDLSEELVQTSGLPPMKNLRRTAFERALREARGEAQRARLEAYAELAAGGAGLDGDDDEP